MKCKICGEKFDVKKSMATFQLPHPYEKKPVNIFMCGYCGDTVHIFINDLQKDFLSLKEPSNEKEVFYD